MMLFDGPHESVIEVSDEDIAPSPHDPKAERLEQAIKEADLKIEKLEAEMKEPKQKIHTMEAALNGILEEMDAADYITEGKNGQKIPGIKVIEYDLKKAKDPARIEELKTLQKEALKRRENFIVRYATLAEDVKKKQVDLKQKIDDLTAEIKAIRRQQKEDKRALKNHYEDMLRSTVLQTSTRDSGESLPVDDIEKQVLLISALEGYLHNSKLAEPTEMAPEAAHELRASLMRYKRNPLEELDLIKTVIKRIGARLTTQEVESLYDGMLLADSEPSN